MTDDLSALDNLRPEVREALIDFDSWMNSHEYHEGVRPRRWFKAIRAELLRLSAMEHAWKQWIKDGMHVEFLQQEPPK